MFRFFTNAGDNVDLSDLPTKIGHFLEQTVCSVLILRNRRCDEDSLYVGPMGKAFVIINSEPRFNNYKFLTSFMPKWTLLEF